MHTKSHYFTRFSIFSQLTILLLLLSACFRDTLTPYISPTVTTSSRVNTFIPQKKALVVSLSEQGVDDILGMQYVFGIFAVTRLYLDQNPAQLASEIISEQLQLNGYQVFVTDHRNVNEIASVLKPNLIINASLKDLSTNAYDAFFFRIAKVSGTLETSVFRLDSKNQLQLHRQIRKDFSDSEFRKFAHVHHLARLLKSEVASTLEEILNSVHPSIVRSKKIPSQKINIILPSNVVLPANKDLLHELAKDHATSKDSLLVLPKTRRAISLAIQEKFLEQGLLTVSVSDNLVQVNDYINIVQPHLEGIVLGADYIEAQLTLDLFNGQKTTCTYREELVTSVSKALWELTKNATAKALSNDPICLSAPNA